MQVVYNGEYSREERAVGCSKCGTGRSINGREVYKTMWRTYYEGRLYIFEQGKEVEVDDILGKFLLQRTYIDKDGTRKHSFVDVAGTVAEEDTCDDKNPPAEVIDIPKEEKPTEEVQQPPVETVPQVEPKAEPAEGENVTPNQ